jgi:hypothetical protein
MSAIAAAASAIAAVASVLASAWLAALTRRMLQIQIVPSISIDFDHEVGSERQRVATIVNESACDLYDLSVRVRIAADFEEVNGGVRPTVYKLVERYDLQRWIIPKVLRRRFKCGAKAQVDSDSWFTHAREVLSLPNLKAAERTARGLVEIDISCRRTADNRRFDSKYAYIVQRSKGKLFALPCDRSNPADVDKCLILKPIDE